MNKEINFNNLDIRVAEIIDTYRIVINKGQMDHLNNEMEFLVFEKGNEIFDPINKKNLGVLEIPKGIFKPLNIQDNITLLVSKSVRKRNPFAIGLPLTFLTEEDEEFEKLRKIKVGDSVKIINKVQE